MRVTATQFRLVFGLILVVAASHTFAGDPFHLSYRQQALSSDGLTQSGILLVTVMNASGEDVQDLIASIAGPNNVTFDNRPIAIGNLSQGQLVEVLDAFRVPGELADPEAMEQSITWTMEYTNTVGDRVTAEVRGERVPQ